MCVLAVVSVMIALNVADFEVASRVLAGAQTDDAVDMTADIQGVSLKTVEPMPLDEQERLPQVGYEEVNPDDPDETSKPADGVCFVVRCAVIWCVCC